MSIDDSSTDPADGLPGSSRRKGRPVDGDSRADLSPEVEHREALRRSALVDGDQRMRLFDGHPVMADKVAVATAPMMEAFKVIRAVVVYRAPGTCLVAVSRHGKTTAIGRIQEELASAFPNLAIGRVIALSQRSGAVSQRTFHGDLLECYRHRRARVGTSADLRKLVLNVWQGECRVKDSDRYLLLVDEAQSWCEECFTWLRDLTNLAQSQGINVITVLFGQPELLQFRDALRTRGRQDIIGRFLLTPREFRGLMSLDDIKQVLQAFDDPARHQYPVGSDICYTEFFMPRAFAAGWRLALESERLWGALSEVARRQPHRQGGIGMQYVFWSIRSFIFEHLQDDGIGFRGDDPAWLRAVESSELEIALS